MFRSLTLGALMAALPLTAALACEGFEVHDAYARASGAMAQSGAAFMVLHNHGSSDCHVSSVRSDVAVRTELHTHQEDAQGVMRMIHVAEGFALPADGARNLERGGDHVMFLGLTRALAEGDEIALSFIFADGAEHQITLAVDNHRQGEGAAQRHNHGHSHGN